MSFDFMKNEGMKVFKTDACVICHDAQPSIILLPCGHCSMCLSQECYWRYIKKNESCPICREVFTQYVKTCDVSVPFKV